ncbi:MAG: EAL domain-containing protein [Betaproteobacteria bacterium]|nr:EAL domain-containing protein [Betaproteobacteria bacterium]
MTTAERKLQDTEQVLLESERRYNQLVQKIPDGIYIFQFDPDGAMGFKYVSPRYCDMLGVKAEAVLQDYHLGFAPAHPDDLDSLIQANETARVTLFPFRWEGRFIIHGKTRWMRISSDPTALPNGGSLWHGLVSDITERKEAEGSATRNAEHFKRILDNLFAYVALLNTDGLVLEINKAPLDRGGYRREDIIGRYFPDAPWWSYEGKVRSKIIAAVETAREGKSSRFEIVTKMGDELVPIDFQISPVRDESGKIVALLPTGVDITERKHAESRLRLAAAAFESHEGMIITDPQGVILQVNQAFTDLTGYSAEEIVGQTPRILKSGRHGDDFYRDMWVQLELTGLWNGEIWDRRKNGEIYPKSLTISAVRNEDGAITHYIATQHDITERKQAEERIKDLAYFDQLTGLPNRVSLQQKLSQMVGLASRNHRQFALMLLDLDNFKSINDTLGHQTGDVMLTEVADRLSTSVRQSDLVARLGGDEFVIILPDIDGPADVARVAQKILVEISAPYFIDARELHTSPSIGICLYPDDATENEDLIKKADVAMYHAKSCGRGNYQFFKEEIQAAAVNRLALEADLRSALEKQQFMLHYQPQLDLRTGRLMGVEALIRWQHPERGMISPLDFIPIAEESGLILPIGDWVLEEACGQLAAWRTEGIEHIKMSVNLAASQFSDHRLPLRIEEILAKTGLPKGSLDLEVTESMTMQSPAETAAMMKVLTGQELSLSIDDFGTGYSSLAYLKLFPINTLKIDRSFVKDIETDQNDADICDVTVLLAHKLGLDVVAEGVETKAQLTYLLSIGCEKIQGYLISKPLPAGQIKTFIRNHTPLSGLGTVELWCGDASAPK